MNHKSLLLGVVLVITLVSGCAGPITQITIVRHADIIGGANPSLTAAGVLRAEALRDRYTNSNIAAVYSTRANRTIQTATPIALAHELEIITYSRTAEVVELVLNDHPGELVVIVGHSNTVGPIAEEFGADLPTGFSHPIDELDFDNMLLVLVNADGDASAFHTTYGTASP